ncbi:rab guanine nucleotide exchange factor S2 [Didymella heteroderae]|uniref:Rab guanine nucleotide exchange factor S2 n=1 Tax=Didymella heteroderae TaxID=1769908 RepID=A0A9P5BWQ8_9PLEO|nr:rab guanine nucleotide exchange factor S2 [Didymella heteroderae]
MAEYAFIHSAAPWVQHSSGTMTPSRLRSLSPMAAKKEVTRSISTPHLAKAASESDGMNTIPDPRAPTPQPQISRHNSTDSHPDLSQEVSTLSTKLINAINHSTMLDDSLQQTRHELEAAKKRLEQLELQVKDHEQKVAKGLLVEKVVYDKMERQMSTELQEERKRRAEAERLKRNTDSEVEQLTAALFEEANVMVAAARKETEASDKRGEQLKQQLSDAEVLQISLQEQLQDLKGVMEKMSSHGGDDESNILATTTAPSTPGITPADKMTKLLEATNLTPNTPGSEEFSPDHPLHFSHLIHPVLRSDLTAFEEFQAMLRTVPKSAPSSRVSSGNYSSLNVLGLGSLTNSSTTSLPSSIKTSSNGNNSPREPVASQSLTNMKDEKFYKRALAEDIEPTLRLDIAPGLSWMARRTVVSSITAGSLVVEPNPPSNSRFRAPILPCSLCGENRKEEKYARKYRFKTADNEDSQRYPLCDWCLGRVRATCDYIGFLRMIAAGHWRAETDDEKKNAWEESVRLRERMFWNRIGGGVVPAFIPMRDSLRSPTFANNDKIRRSEELRQSIEIAVEAPKASDDPFQASKGDAEKRVSIGKTVISPEIKETLTEDEEKQIEEMVQTQLESEVRRSLEAKPITEKPALQRQRSHSNPPPTPPRKKDERLSLRIPGGFE